MAYRAYVEDVLIPATPTDSIEVMIRYQDDATNPPRVIRKPIKYVAGMNRAGFEAAVIEERNKLRNLDAALAQLQAVVGQEVTAT